MKQENVGRKGLVALLAVVGAMLVAPALWAQGGGSDDGGTGPEAHRVYAPIVAGVPAQRPVVPKPPVNPPPNPSAAGISGQVFYQGAAVDDLTLRLDRCGEECTTVSTTSVNAGHYRFTNLPTLQAGERYRVYFVNGPTGENDDDPRYLAFWVGPIIEQYEAGAQVAGGDFDIATVELLDVPWPQTLPATFAWTGRGIATDRYSWAVTDEAGNDLCAMNEPQAATSIMLDEAGAEVCGIQPGRPYRWYVRVIANGDTDQGFGYSYAYGRLEIAGGGSGSAWMQILPGYWFQHQPYPMLFLFRPNGTGVRTTYPTMGLPGGLPTHLTWTLNGDNLILTYATYQEALTLATFNASAAAIELTYPGYGEVVWYGCASGNMPSLIEQTVC